MEKLIKYASGVDMAGDKFDACLLSIDSTQETKKIATAVFTNTDPGFKKYHKWLSDHCKEKQVEVYTLVEATGVYHEELVYFLAKNEKKVSVVLPNKSNKFIASLGLKSKTDGIEAYGLALMCAQQKMALWQPFDTFYYELRTLTRHHQSIQEAKSIFNNQLHALKHSAHSLDFVEEGLEATLHLFDKQLKATTEQIKIHLSSNEEVSGKLHKITKAKGLALLSVATVIAECGGFQFFNNIPGLVSYAGYDVVENQSGNRVGKTKISKQGNSRIRRILHMPALVAVKHEPVFTEFYNRLYDSNKIKMKALVAVQKKLLVLIYTLWKNDCEFDPQYHKKQQVNQDNIAIDSGNDESGVLSLVDFEEVIVDTAKKPKVAPSNDSATQGKLQYNESSEVSSGDVKLMKNYG